MIHFLFILSRRRLHPGRSQPGPTPPCRRRYAVAAAAAAARLPRLPLSIVRLPIGHCPPASRLSFACQQVIVRLSAASSSHPSLPADSCSVPYTLLCNVGSPCIRARIPAPFPRQVVQSPAFTEVGWPIATCVSQCSSTFCLSRARQSLLRWWSPTVGSRGCPYLLLIPPSCPPSFSPDPRQSDSTGTPHTDTTLV